MTINHSLIFKTTRIQKHFPLSVFVFIDSLVVSASQDAVGHTLSLQNNPTFGIGLLVVGVRTVVRAFGRSLRHNQIFLLFILTMGLRRVRFALGSSAKNLIGSLIGAIDEDSRCGFLFSTLLEGKTFSHTFPINCSTKQRCQLYSTNVPEKTREQ